MWSEASCQKSLIVVHLADIHHFYPSVNQEILISLIKKKIKDKKVIDLLIRIIRSFKEGLPIGYHSSQYFGNFYLSYLDHFIKETLHVKYYFQDFSNRYIEKRNFFSMEQNLFVGNSCFVDNHSFCEN